MSGARGDRLAPWMAPLLLVVLAAVIPPVGVLAAAEGAIAAIALATLGWRRRHELAATAQRGFLAALALASLAVAALPTLLAAPGAGAAGEATSRLLFVAFGWSVVLARAPLAPIASAGDAEYDTMGPSGWRAPLLLVGGFFLLAVAAHAIFVGRYAGGGDDVLYLLQSRLMGEPGFVRRTDPSLARFFVIRQMGVFDGRMYTQYPPGWPTLLWAFDAAGLRWLSPCLLAATAVALTYELGRRVRSPRVGLVAAALLASNYWFVQVAASFGAHAATTCLVLGGALLALAGERRAGAPRAAAWIGAGLLLASALAIRPLTGVTVGLSVLLWIAARRRRRGGEVATMAALMAVGGLLPVAGLLYYNLVTNGDVLRFGYQAVNGRLHDLGFGTRGYNSYDPAGRVTRAVQEFTPPVALHQLAWRLWDVASRAATPFLLLPLVVMARTTGFRADARIAAAFLALPALHTFYFYSETRFFTELFPFLYVGAAVMLAHVWARRPALARWWLGLALLGNGALTLLWLAIGAATFPARMAAFDTIEDAARRHGRVVVFVSDSTTERRGLFYTLWWYNVDDAAGRVVVARDLGPENSRLTARLPRHAALRLVGRDDGGYALEPLR